MLKLVEDDRLLSPVKQEFPNFWLFKNKSDTINVSSLRLNPLYIIGAEFALSAVTIQELFSETSMFDSFPYNMIIRDSRTIKTINRTVFGN